MERFLIAPDSFKGSMSSIEICDIIRSVILEHIPNAFVEVLPIADGGEGTVDCFMACIDGERIGVNVTGPDFENVFAEYCVVEDGNTAVIELAAAAGLTLARKPNPATTTTYGVGELIRDAAKRGVKRIILGLGGSATNDAGTGLAAALGVKFFNKAGNEFIPVGGTLSEISGFDTLPAKKLLCDIEIIALCDVVNPLYGKSGAAHVFARQKGADDKTVEMLDTQLGSFTDLVLRREGIRLNDISGGGAAGGAGAGVSLFANAKLKSGIDTVLDMVCFEEKARNKQLIITGEGRTDSQSLDGKAVIGIARRAKKLGVPVAVIAGDLDDDISRLYDEGVAFVLSTNRVAKDFTKIRHRSKTYLKLCADTLMRIINTVKNSKP